MGAKYDPQAEAEVRHWFKQLLNEDIGEGSMTVEKNLKDGILLIKYVRNILPHPYNFNQKNPRNIIMYKCTVLFHQNHHQMMIYIVLLISSHANTNKSIWA